MFRINVSDNHMIKKQCSIFYFLFTNLLTIVGTNVGYIEHFYVKFYSYEYAVLN